MPKNWTDAVADHLAKVPEETRSMAKANTDMIQRVMSGFGPDKNVRDPMLGGKVVVNIASVHIPSFCKDKYKNTYDLKKTPRLGDIPAGEDIPIRTFVDSILAALTQSKAEDIYFGAVELNGTGIRFYGDFSLILKGPTNIKTFVFSTNSYDLVRPPSHHRVKNPIQSNLVTTLQMNSVSGTMLLRWQS